MRRDALAVNYEAIRYNVFSFCRALNFEPTWQQAQLLELIQKPTPERKKIAVKSGKGPGKTTISGVVALWWGIRNKGSKVVLTAPTMRQCKDIWLAEVRRTLQRADPWLQRVIKVTSTKVIFGGEKDWSVDLVTASNPESLQGYHEKNLKVICEEASGIPRELVQTLKDTLSNPRSAMLMIGNPNTRDCAFFDCFNRERGNWETLTFNAEETPSSAFFDPKRNVELELEFGRDSPVYRVAVLGEFPHADPNCVISSEEVERVTKKSLMLPAARRSQVKQFGLDFARYGGDELTLYRRSGEAIVQWERMVRVDPSVLVDKAILWQHQAGWTDDECYYVPDAGGMGQGIMHRFYKAEKNVLEFHNAGRAVESNKYHDRITEAWFCLAKKIRARACYLPADNILIQQLCSRRYEVTDKGKIKVESKEKYTKRCGGSPDRADGVVMAFYDAAWEAEGAVSGGYGESKTVGGITFR